MDAEFERSALAIFIKMASIYFMKIAVDKKKPQRKYLHIIPDVGRYYRTVI